MPEKKRSKAMTGAKNPAWEGGSKSTDALNARKAWQEYWGKVVPEGYVIAHKDNNPTNNSRENLRLMTRENHNRLTKKNKTLKEQAKGVKNKPNIGSSDGVQRRFRK